ncbi:MAG TPA: acyl-ACP desaturase [Armatimonadota bacterium]
MRAPAPLKAPSGLRRVRRPPRRHKETTLQQYDLTTHPDDALNAENLRLDASVERGFDRLFEWFFGLVQKRAWNPKALFQFTPSKVSPDIERVIWSSMGVEMVLPGYMAELIRLTRSSISRFSFSVLWGYEEMRHMLTLMQWMEDARGVAHEKIEQYFEDIRKLDWRLHYDSPRQKMWYTMWQEKATELTYLKVADHCKKQGDDEGARALRKMAGDEAGHKTFFRRGVEVFLEHDAEATLKDGRRVRRTFRMPSHSLLPHDEGVELIRITDSLEILNNRIIQDEVFAPCVRDLLPTIQRAGGYATPEDVPTEKWFGISASQLLATAPAR